MSVCPTIREAPTKHIVKINLWVRGCSGMKRLSVTDAVDLVKVGPGYTTLFGALCVPPVSLHGRSRTPARAFSAQPVFSLTGRSGAFSTRGSSSNNVITWQQREDENQLQLIHSNTNIELAGIVSGTVHFHFLSGIQKLYVYQRKTLDVWVWTWFCLSAVLIYNSFPLLQTLQHHLLT